MLRGASVEALLGSAAIGVSPLALPRGSGACYMGEVGRQHLFREQHIH